MSTGGRCQEIYNDEDGDDDDDGDDGDGDDHRPLDRDGEGGENASGHASVGERVDDVGEQNCEDIAVRLR